MAGGSPTSLTAPERRQPILDAATTEQEFAFCGIISGTARCVNTKRPLTRQLAGIERGLAMDASQDEIALLAQRLLVRSERSAEGCLRWTGAHVSKGYGQIVVNGRKRSVHVVAHEIWIGPVPEGYDVDHVHAKGCRHRDCLEPSHLEAVTHAENTRRAAELITHCPQGHEYTPDNIKWMTPHKPGLNRLRCCRRCFNAARRAKRARNHVAATEGPATDA